ncbi:MAG: undecaprenyl-diphosphatase [Pseudomonadota bacterium]|nr:undecaprenyl-diphosphatase [Pseudomonadota bacterium]
MNNLHLFELINAPPGLGPGRLALATLMAQWAIYGLPLGAAVAWWRGPRAARIDWLQVAFTILVALALAQIVAHVWPQPRPFALNLGTQYLAHTADPGLPSDHVVVIWTAALALLRIDRFAIWGLPLLALGLVVGWCRVYLGVHFPLDIVAALPVAAAATLVAGALEPRLMPAWIALMDRHDRIAQRLRRRSAPVHDAGSEKR